MRLEKVSYPSYPTIAFLRKHGSATAVVIALLPLLVALFGFWNGLGIWVPALGAICSVIAFAFARVMVELVWVVTDLLLPR